MYRQKVDLRWLLIKWWELSASLLPGGIISLFHRSTTSPASIISGSNKTITNKILDTILTIPSKQEKKRGPIIHLTIHCLVYGIFQSKILSTINLNANLVINSCAVNDFIMHSDDNCGHCDTGTVSQWKFVSQWYAM